MRRLRDTHGQSLMEVLVAMVLMVGALAAITGIFATFVQGGSDQDKLTAAQDTARTQLDAMTRTLRNARAVGSLSSPVLVANPNDVVVGTADWPGTGGLSGASIVRYCVDTATRTLWFDGLRTLASGSTTPGPSCPSTASGWTHMPVVQGIVANSGAPGAQLFTYTTTATGTVTGVDISLRVDGGNGGRARVTSLRTSAAIRSLTGQPPAVSASDVRVQCNPDHSALLSLGVSTDQNGNPLDVVFRTADGVQLGTGSSVGVAASLQGALTVTVTNVLGLQTVLTKNVSC